MAELVFERSGVALETTSGTPIANPTHYLPFPMTLVPQQTVYRPEEARGYRARFNRSKVVKKWSEWSVPTTGVDLYNLPVLFNLVAPLSSPTTPGGATNSRLWTFTRSQNSVTEKTATLFWGDPNIQSFQAAYAVMDDFTITADASGDEAVTFEANGRAQTLAKIAAPTWPAMLVGPMVTPLESQVWIDTSSAIGTTSLAARVISSTFKVQELKGDPKFLFAGPTASKTYARFGANTSYATLNLQLEVLDMTQYDLLMAESLVKVRVRHNGPLIEAGFYSYIEYDIYGILDEPDWGEAFGTNRTLNLTVTSEYNTTAAHDWILRIQNDRTAL